MEKITLKNRKGQNIVGLLEKPMGEIKGTAVLQHGWGSRKESNTIQSVKKGFQEAGFQTFNFDTTNSFNESDGDYEESTLGLHWEDFEDVVKWLQEQDWFGGPLAVSGHSKGGYSVVRYAEEHPGEVGFIVSVAPVVSGKLSFEASLKRDPDLLKKWKEEGVKVSEKNANIKREHWFQMEERLQHDLLPNADRVISPTLFIVGEYDLSCPVEQIRQLYEVMGTEDKELKIITGAPHSFYKKEEQKECSGFITDWLNKRV